MQSKWREKEDKVAGNELKRIKWREYTKTIKWRETRFKNAVFLRINVKYFPLSRDIKISKISEQYL